MQSPIRDSQETQCTPIYPVDPVAKFNSKNIPIETNQKSNKWGRRTRGKKKAFPYRPRVTQAPSQSSSKWLEQRQKPCKKHT